MKKLSTFFWNTTTFVPKEKLILKNKKNKLNFYSSITFIFLPFYKIINFCLTEHPKQIYKFLKYKNLLSRFIFIDKDYKIFLKKILSYLFYYKKEILNQYFEVFQNPKKSILNFFENNLSPDATVYMFLISLLIKKNF